MKKTVLIITILLLEFGYGRFQRLGACFLAPDSWYDCFDVIVIDTLAYLASEDLAIINISQPDSPFIVTRLDTNHVFRNAILPRYPYAFVLGSNSVGSFDISNIISPVFLDSVGIQFLFNDLEIKDGYAYCTGEQLHIVEILAPDSLVYLGIIDSTILPGRLTRSEDYLFELIGICSLFVYSINDPSNPQRTGSCILPSAAALGRSEPQYRDSVLYYARAVLGNPTLTLNTVDVRDPYNPVYITSSPPIGTYISDTRDLALTGNFAYITFNVHSDITFQSSYQGENPQISVFDISNPNNPIPVWHNEDYPVSGGVGIDARADTIFLCDGDSFYIYVDTLWTDVKEEWGPQVFKKRLQCYPNPCHDYLWLENSDYSNKIHTLTHVSIYEISGRLLHEFSPITKPGTNRILWNLITEGGKKIPDGVYFIKCDFSDCSTCIIKIIKL